jgi:hypothetical protein
MTTKRRTNSSRLIQLNKELSRRRINSGLLCESLVYSSTLAFFFFFVLSPSPDSGSLRFFACVGEGFSFFLPLVLLSFDFSFDDFSFFELLPLLSLSFFFVLDESSFSFLLLFDDELAAAAESFFFLLGDGAATALALLASTFCASLIT